MEFYGHQVPKRFWKHYDGYFKHNWLKDDYIDKHGRVKIVKRKKS